MYPDELTIPMRKDLTEAGFTELTNVDEVDKIMSDKEGTTLVVVNSVCGCAAGTARPGVKKSLDGDKKPSKLVTVFAGVHSEATNKAREYMLPYPPSSPSLALFKEGELVHVVERHHIEGRSAEMIAGHLKQVYEEFC